MAVGRGSYFGGGAGTVNVTTNADATARATANENKAKLALIYPQPGDSVAAGSEVFLLADGKLTNYENNTAAAIVVPATQTDMAIRAAGFTTLAASSTPVVLPKTFNIQRTDNALTAPTAGEAASPTDGDAAEIVTLNGTYQKWTRTSGAWVKQLEQVPPAAVDVDFKQTWATMQATLAADEKFTAVEPAGTATLVYSVPTALNGAAKGATWDATEAARYTKIGPASVASAVTQVLANGDTPAPGQVYVQAVGATHVVPTLTSGQRTTVVNKLADGKTIETTYLHDGTSQTTSVIGGGSAAVAMTGATATVAGAAGLVPAPAIGDQDDVLHGDGTWRASLVSHGLYMGSAGTFAGLPLANTTRATALNGDWAILSADDIGTGTAAAPQFRRGVYTTNGTAYTLSARLDTDLNITGLYIGSAATFAALPTAGAANGDWAALSADEVGTGTVAAPQYQRGIYIYNGTAYTFAVALDAARLALLTQTQAEKETDTNSGLISGQRLNQSMNARDGRVHVHYGSGDTVDFNTAHNLTGDFVRTFSFDTAASLTNPPQSGAALGVTGHAFYFGDATDGQQFVYFLKDSLDRETEYWRSRSGGNWLAWNAVSSDTWLNSQAGWQISSGMHVKLGDGHAVSFLSVDRTRAIRIMPVSDWANVGTITAASGWTFDASFPGSGKQEVVLVPHATLNRWHVSAVAAPTRRTITGSATGSGIDGEAVPVMIALTPGTGLDTVTATNGATVSSINTMLGTCLVTVNGQNTVLTHTTKSITTFNGLQKVGETDHAATALTTAGVAFTLAAELRDGDLLEVLENYNNNTTEDHVLWAYVTAGRTCKAYQYPSESNAAYFVFPATLTKVITLKGAANQYIKKIRIWRDAANGYVTPTATTVRQPVDVTVNGAGAQTLFAGTSARITATPPAGQILQSVTAPAGLTVAISDTRTGALEVAIAAGTTGTRDITATFVTPGLAKVIAAANGGVSIQLGTLLARIPASGNRSIQLASATGAAINLRIQNLWQGGGAGTGIVTMALAASAATFSYVNSGWNFTTAGQWQDIIIEDTTNNRWYRLRVEIGASFNNNSFGGYEII